MKLTVIRGLPGSGKTYFANLCVGMGMGVNIATDDYFMVDGQYCFDGDKLHQAHQWNIWRCEQLMKAGKDVIVSNTCTVWKEVKPYFELAQKYQYKIDVMEPGTQWQHDLNTCFEKNTHNVPFDVIQKMSDRWESTASIRAHIKDYV